MSLLLLFAGASLQAPIPPDEAPLFTRVRAPMVQTSWMDDVRGRRSAATDGRVHGSSVTDVKVDP